MGKKLWKITYPTVTLLIELGDLSQYVNRMKIVLTTFGTDCWMKPLDSI